MYKVFSIRYLQFIKYFPKVWIFGMVERETNTLLIYPVSDRSEDTLLPIIQRHVEPGSTIYSDGLSAYCGLNDLGYHHFTVLHKYSFKKVYIQKDTREEVEIHTNRTEGAWKHAKEHFRRMSGQYMRNNVEGRGQITCLRAFFRVPEKHLQSEWPTSINLSNPPFPNKVWARLQFST